MALPGLFWIELGLGVVLLLLSAKAHGRQIRLERELEGHFEVDFMRENDPWVEALWKRDRRQFWMTFPATAAALTTLVLLAGPGVLTSRFGTEPLGSPVGGALVLALLLWAPSAALIGNGLTSGTRLRRRLDEPRPQGRLRDEVRTTRGAWLTNAVKGTFALWGVVFALAGLAAGLLALG